jgi:hypothetical protein
MGLFSGAYMPWIQHKLSRLQRYAQGVALITKYTDMGYPTEHYRQPMLITTMKDLPSEQDMELLRYLGWVIKIKLTPYIGEYENHYEVHWAFHNSQEFWVNDQE